MLAQIIDLTYPKVFEKYRSKYDYAWDNHHQGLLGLEIRKIKDDYFNQLKVKLNKLCKLSYFLESAGDTSRILLLGNSKNFREVTEKCSDDSSERRYLQHCKKTGKALCKVTAERYV